MYAVDRDLEPEAYIYEIETFDRYSTNIEIESRV